MPTPLLILSDAPTSGTGLGRITRDLATRIHAHLPEFRVGTLGCYGAYSRHLPFPQYVIEMDDWVVGNLPEVWKDFSFGEKGILLTIWDGSRLGWLARPETCAVPMLQGFLKMSPFEKWAYLPIDASGVNGKLTKGLTWIIDGFDRVLAYSNWAESILKRTQRVDLDLGSLPHGIDTSVFYPRPRVQARHNFGHKLKAMWRDNQTLISVPDDALLVGIVATNQTRKDWGLGIATVAQLAKDRKVIVWCKTDVMDRQWSMQTLLTDFDLLKRQNIVTDLEYEDDTMAWAYSACDVTLGIGNGEGFGFPIFESLACGTPCIHGNYGGAAEHMPPAFLIEPIAERIEGVHNSIRKVYSPESWASAALHSKDVKFDFPRHLDWDELWPRWEQWLKAGLK